MMISPNPPRLVRYPIMLQNWESLTFFHWRYDASVVRPLIPPGLELDTFDGSAWVSLTPFLLTGLRVPFTAALPWLGRFPETNVRTYVIGPGGHRGVWFFSLDAARLAAVHGARLSYGLPYRWSRMKVEQLPDSVHYSGLRRATGAVARYSITVTPGQVYAPDELNDGDHFLTARYRLYSQLRSRLVFADIEHVPWPLARARVDSMEQTMIQAAGMPPPSGDPVVHFSRFIFVKIGRPFFVEESRSP